MNYYLGALKKYAVFIGRARRSEYCYFVLFNIVFQVTAAIFDNILGSNFNAFFGDGMFKLPFGYLFTVYNFAVLIPRLAVAVRRLHDVGKNAWFMLFALVPLIGSIWLLVLCLSKGVNGENEYGTDPKRN